MKWLLRYMEIGLLVDTGFSTPDRRASLSSISSDRYELEHILPLQLLRWLYTSIGRGTLTDLLVTTKNLAIIGWACIG